MFFQLNYTQFWVELNDAIVNSIIFLFTPSEFYLKTISTIYWPKTNLNINV